MELEKEQESNDFSTNLSDISENEDELPVKEIENEDELPVRGIANLFGKLSNKIESGGDIKISENEDDKPVKGIANLFRKLSNKIGKEGEIKKSKKLDLTKSNINENVEKDFDIIPSNKSTDGNEVSNLGTDKTSNSVLSDVSRNESEEDEPGLILSDNEEKARKQKRQYSTPLSHDVKERHMYDYKPMCPPRFTSNSYRSESNYPEAFHVRERIASKDGGSYVRYYTQNAEYDDSSYFSQSEPSAHRDYSEELKYYKYRDHKRRDKSLDKEYYDEHTPEKRRDNRKKDGHISKKSRKDREAPVNDDSYERENRKRKYEKYGSHNKLENDYEEKPASKHTYEAERKSRRRRRRKSSSHEEMSDDSCIIEEDLRDVRKKRSKKGKKSEKDISIIESSEDDNEKTTRKSEEKNIRSKKEFSKERNGKRNRSKGERSLERTGHKTDINKIDNGQKRISDEHKISEHRKEKKYDRSKRIDRETENLNELKEKTTTKSENVSSSKNSESSHDAALWVTLQNMAKLHNEKYKEFKNNPLKYPNYKEEYDLFSKLQTEKKSEFGESSKELDLDQEWELYWPKRLNEIVKEKWVTKKEEFIKNKNSMKLYIDKKNSSSMKPLTKVNIKCSDKSKKQDDDKVQKNPNTLKKVTNHTQLSAPSSAHVDIPTKVSNIELKYDLVNETVPVNKENCLQQSNSSHSVNQPCKKDVKTEVLEKNVSAVDSIEKGKVSTVDDGIVWLLRFLLTLKKNLASLIGPIEGLYNEAIEFQNKGISPIKILDDSGHKMVLQLVVNKFVNIINSDNLSMGEKALYGKIMEQLNNLIKGGSQINTKQQVESQDKTKTKEKYPKSFNNEDSYVVNDDNRKVQIESQDNNQIKEEYHTSFNNEDSYVSNDYNRKAQVESQENQIKEEYYRTFNKGDYYNPNDYNRKPQIDSQENQIKEEYHRSYNREDSYAFNDFNHKEQKESQHSHMKEEYRQNFNNHNSYNFNDYNRKAQIESQGNQIKEEYPRSYNRDNSCDFQDYNHRLQVESQDNRMKGEYHKSIKKEDPNVYKDYNHTRDKYQENIPKEHANNFQKDEDYQGIQEAKQIMESQDLNDEEIDDIARKTMGRNSDEMIKFIEHALTYKGINVESKEKLRSIFMSVREKQFGIIGS